MNTRGDDPGDDSIPLWLLHENEVDAWRATQWRRRWRAGSRLNRISKERSIAWCCVAGSSGGGLECGGGRPGQTFQGELSLWHAAGFVERLPAAALPSRAAVQRRDEATQLCLGFRLRRLPLRPLSCGQERGREHRERRRMADMQDSLRSSRRSRCAWRAIGSINTPAQDLGPAELGGRGPRAGPSVTRPRFKNGWGRACSPRNFPTIHAVGRASSQAPPAGRAALRRRAPAKAYPRLTLVGKGRVLRQRRPGHQARVRHGPDEEGHGRAAPAGRAGAGAHAHERATGFVRNCAC